MAKKRQIKEYYIAPNGKLVQVNSINIKAPVEEKVEEKVSVPVEQDPIAFSEPINEIEKTVVKYNEMSRTNPFLYNYNLESPMSLHSIEDFYVKKGKKELSFRSLVRSNFYRRAKRKRILKKGFKTWDEEVNQKLLDLQNYGTVQYNNNKWMQLPKIKVFGFMFNIIGFLFSIILVNESILMLGVLEGVFKQITYLCILIFIGIFFIGILINRIINTNARVFKKNKQCYNSEVAKIMIDYKKKFKKTSKYYLKNMPKNANNFRSEILLLDETSIQLNNIKKVEDIVADGSKQLIKSNKRSVGIKFSKFIYMFLLTCSSLYVYGYAIYKIALYFIDKINS